RAPGIVVEHVDPAIGGDRELDRLGGAFRLGDIGLNEGGLAAGGANLLSRRFSLLTPPSRQDHLRPFPGEQPGGFAADAAGGAGDQGHLSLQSRHRRSLKIPARTRSSISTGPPTIYTSDQSARE